VRALYLSVGLLAAQLCASAQAQQASLLPTRMQMCATELASVSGDERKTQLRTCLQRRAEAEPLVERECSQHVSSVPMNSQNDKLQLRKQCLSRALEVSYLELPRRPPRAPKPVDEAPADIPAEGKPVDGQGALPAEPAAN
jgi:hypothetical protein